MSWQCFDPRVISDITIAYSQLDEIDREKAKRDAKKHAQEALANSGEYEVVEVDEY